MKELAILIKPASSLCDMRCTYCFYADVARARSVKSYGIMPAETAHAIIDNVFSDLSAGDKVTFAFQGGEPTVAGLAYFEDFCAYAMQQCGGISVSFALQTNGYTIDEVWCELLVQYNFLVGISIDGDQSIHNENRKTPGGEGTYKRIMHSKKLLEQFGIECNVLSVLTSSTARHPKAIWDFLVKENIRFVQFIPCMDVLASGKKSNYSLSPKRFYSFYRALFTYWASAMETKNYFSIKLFDDLANLYLGRTPTACGISGHCGIQYVVEADGSTFPCDFYVLDEYYIGSLAEAKPSQIYPRALACGFLRDARGYEREEPCSSCPYLQTCGGGCKRMKDTQYIKGSVCYYRKLLDEILEPLLGIASKY